MLPGPGLRVHPAGRGGRRRVAGRRGRGPAAAVAAGRPGAAVRQPPPGTGAPRGPRLAVRRPRGRRRPRGSRPGRRPSPAARPPGPGSRPGARTGRRGCRASAGGPAGRGRCARSRRSPGSRTRRRSTPSARAGGHLGGEEHLHLDVVRALLPHLVPAVGLGGEAVGHLVLLPGQEFGRPDPVHPEGQLPGAEPVPGHDVPDPLVVHEPVGLDDPPGELVPARRVVLDLDADVAPHGVLQDPDRAGHQVGGRHAGHRTVEGLEGLPVAPPQEMAELVPEPRGRVREDGRSSSRDAGEGEVDGQRLLEGQVDRPGSGARRSGCARGPRGWRTRGSCAGR